MLALTTLANGMEGTVCLSASLKVYVPPSGLIGGYYTPNIIL